MQFQMMLHFNRYQPDIKVAKSNSLLVANRLFFFLKKDYEGNPAKAYIIYDYETRIQIAFSYEKDKIESLLYNLFERDGVIDDLDTFFKGLPSEKK